MNKKIIRAESIKTLEAILIERIKSKAILRKIYHVSTSTVKVSQAGINNRFISKHLQELTYTHGYTNNSNAHCRYIARETIAEMDAVLIELFGSVIQIKKMSDADIARGLASFEL